MLMQNIKFMYVREISFTMALIIIETFYLAQCMWNIFDSLKKRQTFL